MTVVDTDIEILAALDFDLFVPCERQSACKEEVQPAAWVVHLRCPGCESEVERLLCSPCLFRLHFVDVSHSEGSSCGNISPGPEYIVSVSPYNQGGDSA